LLKGDTVFTHSLQQNISIIVSLDAL